VGRRPPVRNVSSVRHRCDVSLRTDTPVLGPVLIRQSHALLAPEAHFLLETHQLGALRLREEAYQGVPCSLRHAPPKHVLQVVGVMHKGGSTLERMILAHVKEVGMNHVDVSLRDHSRQGHRNVLATIFLGDEWTGLEDVARRSREHRGTRTYEIDAHDLFAVRSQVAKVITIAGSEEKTEQKHVVPLGGFTEKAEIADSGTICERPGASRDEGEDSHGLASDTQRVTNRDRDSAREAVRSASAWQPGPRSLARNG